MCPQVTMNKPLIMQFSPTSCHFISLRPKYSSQHPVLKPPQSMFLPRNTLRSKIHNLITFIWHKEKLPDQWKESIIVPVHKKGDKTECSNYRGVSLISTSYKPDSGGN
ncbi:hypothetical protein B7P43_G07496 [Cryptotermes secundus]|uniref:Uncharacterized protein n=1 Tax=Cryptotermes secundus TaxID=105785 RepID=A0A2J7PSJ7_9NEOP|nr:hypothetical protein B7P43_G07496 [Cryptotermes secundus]